MSPIKVNNLMGWWHSNSQIPSPMILEMDRREMDGQLALQFLADGFWGAQYNVKLVLSGSQHSSNQTLAMLILVSQQNTKMVLLVPSIFLGGLAGKRLIFFTSSPQQLGGVECAFKAY